MEVETEESLEGERPASLVYTVVKIKKILSQTRQKAKTMFRIDFRLLCAHMDTQTGTYIPAHRNHESEGNSILEMG